MHDNCIGMGVSYKTPKHFDELGNRNYTQQVCYDVAT